MDFEISDLDIVNTEKISLLVRKAQYSEALRFVRELKAKNKNKAIYHIQESALLGDQPTNDPAMIKRQKKTAANSLKRFIKHADEFNENTKNFLLNEYYWFAEKPQEQFLFGQKLVTSGNLNGYYSQGVGSAFYAYLLMKKGKVSEAQKWALISEKAWTQYFKKVGKDYYNAFCWYALALGLNEKFKNMYAAFEKAEVLSQQPASYSEFRHFKQMIFDTLTLNPAKAFQNGLKLPLYWYVYNEDLRKVLLKNHNLLLNGEVEQYYKISQELPKKFPQETYAHIKALALWGDWGQHLSGNEEAKYKAMAVKKYNALKKTHSFENWRIRDIFKNELYYHSNRFLNQYKLGKEINKERPTFGDFSMGVGASELANQFAMKRKHKEAKKWAHISIKHWRNHYSMREGNIEKDYFYIQALYISGKKSLARKLALNVMAESSDFENASWINLFKRWGRYK
ncbi:MAG: hypothetical protein ACXVCA_01995 [Bdellovibrio sp.]